jgi:hypothetical protein
MPECPVERSASLWERACSRKRYFIQHSCWLTHRFREQARSHIDLCIAKFIESEPKETV